MLANSLSPQHRRICEEYVRDYNAGRVAEACGVSVNAVYAVRKKKEAAEYIAWLENNRSARTAITADRVLQELARIAFADPRRLVQVDDEGRVSITPTSQLSDDDAACISSIDTTMAGPRIKIHDKMAALDKIGKHLGMFAERVDQRMTVAAMPAVVVDGHEVDFDVGSDPDGSPSIKKDGGNECD